MRNFKESDWKLFRSRLEDLREKYLEKKNIELRKYLSDPDKSATEQFWDTFESMKNEEAILNQCLVGYSRSKMFFHILAMYQCGMMTDEDLRQFSDEVQDYVRYMETE